MGFRAATFLVILLLIALPLAGDAMDFGVGPFIQFQADPFSPETRYATWIDTRNYLNGYEARVRLQKLELDGHLFLRQGNIKDVTEEGKPVYEDDIAQKLFGALAVGFSTEVASYTRLGFALAFPMGIDVATGYVPYFWMGRPHNIFSTEDRTTFMRNITFDYRFKFDLRIAHFIFSAMYQVPSADFSIARFNQAALAPQWSQGKLGFALVSMFW